MRAAYDSYSQHGFEILSVSIREGDAEVAAFIDRHGLTYPFLMDRTGQIATTYEISSTPTTYFIAPDGTIADSFAGVVSQGWLKENLDEFIAT